LFSPSSPVLTHYPHSGFFSWILALEAILWLPCQVSTGKSSTSSLPPHRWASLMTSVFGLSTSCCQSCLPNPLPSFQRTLEIILVHPSRYSCPVLAFLVAHSLC
jgi:hypothetical protein